MTVLYADNDENDAFFMERAFTRMGIRGDLQVVSDGQLVTQYLLGTGAFADREKFPPPSLVLLDVKMPHMSGLEALQWIRERPGFDPVKIVMLTSSTQQSDIEFCAFRGANGYLVKPSRSDQLADLMPGVLEAAAKARGRQRLNIAENRLPD